MAKPSKKSRGFLTKTYVGPDVRLRLFEACQSGTYTEVRHILRANAFDINDRDDHNRSLVALASKGGHHDVVQLLLENGANVNVCTTTGVTPLHEAAKGEHTRTVKILLNAGADCTAMDANHLMPIDHARYYSETWMVLKDADEGIQPTLEGNQQSVILPPHIIPCAILEAEYKRRKEQAMKENKAKQKKDKKNKK